MTKYMFIGSYTQEGLAGLRKEGGSGRREGAARLIESFGGSLETLYFAFGENDFYAVVDLPGNANATAASLLVNSVGAISVKTVVLLTPEEVDEAVKIQGSYRAPGQ